MIKNILLTFLLGLCILVPMGASAQLDLGADLTKNAAGTAGYDGNTNEQTFAQLIGTIIKGFLSFIGVIFLVLMVYAGYLWMTAQGEESQIEKAQEIIKSSIIGLIITVGAYTITAFVVPKIVGKATGESGPQAPSGDGLAGCCAVEQRGVTTKINQPSASACNNHCKNINRANDPDGLFGNVNEAGEASCEFEFVVPGNCK
jgi:amino acid transporter